MNYQNSKIAEVAEALKRDLAKLTNKSDILKSAKLKALYSEIPSLAEAERASFGQELNSLKQELVILVDQAKASETELAPIDVTAPFDANVPTNKRPVLLPANLGSCHPLMTELDQIIKIFYGMGFSAVESREIDDDYHMFGSLNFPEGHPARDDYDTFVTTDGLIAPAHTSTMQNRVLVEQKSKLETGSPIAVVIPGRVFRNEDLDARHEHTFYQIEGVYVDEGVHAGMLIATLKAFLGAYFQKDIKVKIQPFYFPFTEPSFEFAASCIFCDGLGCHICSQAGWIELGGCGLIHPNVLSEAGIDAVRYTGFAWGFGIERLVMLKYGIEDIRHFESGRLDFLRQFA